MDELCFISNKYQPPNNLAKYQYFYTRDFIFFLHLEKKLALSIAKYQYFYTGDFISLLHFKKNCRFSSQKFFETSTFYHMPTSFSQWKRCAVFQIKIDRLVIYQNLNIFTQETFYPSFISKKNGPLHRKRFPKHLLFTTFSLFLTVSEVCNISNKYWLPNN